MLSLKSFFLLSLLFSCSSAYCEGQQKEETLPFRRNDVREADLNADRRINFEEFSSLPSLQEASAAQRRTLFSRLDKDQDAVLSAKELRKERPPKKQGKTPHWLKKLDHNADGKISQTEFLSGKKDGKASSKKREALFEKLDRNGDGYLSRLDRRRPPAVLLLRQFKTLDLDGSGTLNFQEFAQSNLPRTKENPESLFKKLDKNKDAQLERVELRRFIQKKNSSHTPPEK